MAEQSRVHRFEVGDKVFYDDVAEWPVVTLEGTIVGFDNEELTYLVVDFGGDDNTKVLTEDEVRR